MEKAIDGGSGPRRLTDRGLFIPALNPLQDISHLAKISREKAGGRLTTTDAKTSI